ncbi:MAG: DnaJ domain-containing protein [Paludibacteraceae bacterium]|nr:DnaJ domain-containing protein [Paludibacteraceae bacterium]
MKTRSFLWSILHELIFEKVLPSIPLALYMLVAIFLYDYFPLESILLVVMGLSLVWMHIEADEVDKLSYYEGLQAEKEELSDCAKNVRAVARISAILMMYNGGYERTKKIFSEHLARYYEEVDADYAEKVIFDELSVLNASNGNWLPELKRCCLEVNRTLTYEKKRCLLELLFEIAALDGISSKERDLLSRIMGHIRIKEADRAYIEGVFARYYVENLQGARASSGSKYPQRIIDAYAKLGLRPGADLEEVKRAYRRLVFENHPDRFVNASESARVAAEERTRELNRAMETIEKFAS